MNGGQLVREDRKQTLSAPASPCNTSVTVLFVIGLSFMEIRWSPASKNEQTINPLRLIKKHNDI
jgi:hypothetical protein